MADVARMANVSMSTVSRALADSPLIPLEKRLEIQKIASDAGYVINQAARSLRMRKTETIAVIFPLGHDIAQLISDPFFIEMFARLADEITKRDYQVLLSRVTSTPEGWLDKIIQSQRQDGIILVGQSDQDAAIRKASATFRPLVVWGVNTPAQVYGSVGTDNFAGGRIAVEHLLSLGRRRIAFLGRSDLPEIALRQQGYFEALDSAGIQIDTLLSVPVSFSVEAAYEAAIALIKSGVKFDAIFAASDVIALATIRALKEFGIAVPHDVSVVGYDDIIGSDQAVPPLTTVRQDLSKAAEAIVHMLFQKIDGKDAPSVTLDPRLIIRKSCGSTSAE